MNVELPNAIESYGPRSCDCDFCQMHGASYITDPRGRLHIQLKNKSDLHKYRQGSETADFLVCRNCGVLVGVIYESQGTTFGAVNSNVIDDREHFGENVVVSPKKLSKGEKTKRWEEIWFPNVTFS